MIAPLPSLSSAPADRIELMQTFVRIVEAGSLSAAAAQMGTTQPTVSRRLQALERSLGVRLLQRSTHAMKLTEDGERCFDRAKELILSWNAFEPSCAAPATSPRAGCAWWRRTPSAQLLVGPLAAYLTSAGDGRVAAARRPARRNARLHRRGRRLRGARGPGERPGAGRDPVVGGAAHRVRRAVDVQGVALPTHPGELEALPWLAARNFYRTEVVLTHEGTGEVVRVPIRPRLVTDSLYALRSAVLLGVGAGVSSAWMLSEEIAAGRLVHLLPQWRGTPAPVHIVYPYARFYPAKLRLFVEAMRTAFPAS
jgi:DNA-binding transcriptional LysR family regulator